MTKTRCQSREITPLGYWRFELVAGFVALLLILSHPLAPQGRSQDSPAPPTADRVELELRVQRLVQQLDNPERQVREAAEQELIELGEGVLPLLPEVTPQTAAETKERITRIRGVLDQAAIKAAMNPSRVNVEGEFTLAEILEQFQQQTGNRVILLRDSRRSAPGGGKLKVQFRELDFWRALDELLDQTGMSTNSYSGEPRTLGIVAAGRNPSKRLGEGCYAGIFRLEATEVQAQRLLRSSAGAALKIRLEVLWEPRVLPVLIRQPYADLQVTADDGTPIAVASPEGVAEAPIQSTVAGIDLILPLQAPSRSVQKIASLKGRLLAMVPGREEAFEFDQLANARNVSQQRGGLEVTLERVRRNGAVYEFRIRLRLLKEDDTFQSHLDWASNNVVYLVNSKGQKVDNPNFERYLEREREVGMAYLFPLADNVDDYRLVYRSPAGMLTVPVEYELHDIALP